MSGNQWPSTNASLLAQVREGGSPEAWTLFVELYGPILYRYCCSRQLQDSDSEDVTENVLMRVLRSVKNHDPVRGRFRDWLGAVVKNEVNRFLGKENRPGQRGQGGTVNEVDVTVADEHGLWVEGFYASILEKAMERIKPEFDSETWFVFCQVWKEDVPSDAVAEKMKMPASWVYKKKFNVLSRLKQEIAYLTDDHPFIA